MQLKNIINIINVTNLRNNIYFYTFLFIILYYITFYIYNLVNFFKFLINFGIAPT